LIEIETEAQLVQHRDLEADEEFARLVRQIEAVQDDIRRFEEMRMRITLRQEPQQRRQSLDAIGGHGRFHEPGGAQRDRLDLEHAEMLVEASPPCQIDHIARLQHRLHAPRPAAAHQPEMTPMGLGHRLDDNRCFAVLADAQHDAAIVPFHGRKPSTSEGSISSRPLLM
jgi:hypothetical protein